LNPAESNPVDKNDVSSASSTSTSSLDWLRRLRRDLSVTRSLRLLSFLALMAVVVSSSQLPSPMNKRVFFGVFIGTLILWAFTMMQAARFGQQLRTASTLLNIGRLEDAEVWLQRVLKQFSWSTQVKTMAAQHYAALFFRRDAHEQVVQICQELLKERMAHIENVWVNTRLMLADSLLLLGQVPAAYDAIRPLYDSPLSLVDRMRLLPIQLRYELGADYATAAVQNLPEKVELAELLDSPRASLVHALLAEACRRLGMAEEQTFLAERAWLYYDVDQLTSRYPVIAPIAAL